MTRTRVHILAALLLLVSVPIAGAGAPPRRVLLDVRVERQPYMRCLAASVSAVLGYWGARVVPEALADRVAVYKDGLSARELVGVLGEFGFRGFLVQPPFEDLLHHLEQRRPLIVTVVSGESRHALVLAGFDTETKVVWLNDPATGERRSESMDAFQHRWEEGQRWTLLIVPQS